MHIVLLGGVASAIDELAAHGHVLTVLYAEHHRGDVEPRRGKIANVGFVPVYDRPELAWFALRHLGVTGDIDRVLPMHEMAVVSAVILNRMLGLAEQFGETVAIAGRDKAFQKTLWRRHGIPTSRHVVLTDSPRDLADLRHRLAGTTPPYVAKPPAEGGSALVTACPDVPALFEALNTSGLRHAVVEERCPGDEWHFDGALVDGEIKALMVSKYMAPLIETKQGSTLRSIAHPPARHPDLYGEALEFSQRATDALGGRQGVFHLEVFGSPGAFVAGEVGWRPAGVLAPRSALHTIGLDLWTAHASLLAGHGLPVRVPTDGLTYGFVCLPVKPGAVNMVSRDELAALPGVAYLKMKIPVGQVMPAQAFSTTCVAMALIAAPDIQTCGELIDQAVRRTDDLHEQRSRMTSVEELLGAHHDIN